jgi:hypothetical protein
MTSKVTIMRRWNDPRIQITVTREDISLEMSLSDFIYALTDEAAEPLVRDVIQMAGSPALVMTKAQLERKLVAAIESARSRAIFERAAETIVTAVKHETTKLM